MSHQIKTIQFRRKRSGKTNYRKRLRILLSNKTRLVVRKSLKHVMAQLVEYNDNGDKVLVGASSSELKKLGWKGNTGNIVAGYLTGYLLGKKALQKKVKDAVLDSGMTPSVKGSRVYAVVKGIAESGLAIPVDKDMLPNDDITKGKAISSYAQHLKSDNTKYAKYFSSYLKQGIKPEDLASHIEQTKKAIEGKK